MPAQIITFTFPHIGNVGTNREDIETTTPAARGLVVRAPITEPANWRAAQPLDSWLKSHGLVGVAGVDTRRLTRHIRDQGPPNGVIAYEPEGRLDIAELRERAAAWPGLEGMDLAREVTCRQTYEWTETVWRTRSRLRPSGKPASSRRRGRLRREAQHPAHAGRAWLPGDGGAGHRLGRGHPAPSARRHFSVERAGRPGRHRRIRGAGAARADPIGQADLRHLPRPPADGAGARRPDPQDGTRPSRRQPPGQGSA